MFDPVKNEEEIARYWREKDIMQKVRAKGRGKKSFYFLDGPPFVTGDLHLGQVWTKAYKDMVLRYKRFRNFDVVDRAGYDTQGLPAENLVEKKLKITSKKEIEDRIGIESFIKACRDEIDHYISTWKNDFDRFGVSLDFSDPYLPHSNQYMEGEWALFKTIADKGYLYPGSKTTAYCPHCESVVSQGSMEVEHYDEKDPSIFITFPVDAAHSKKAKVQLSKGTDLLVWTTTPWTLPANVAVAVNPKALYVTAKLRNREVVLAKDAVDRVSALLNESIVVLNEFYGSELEGTRYINSLERKVPHQLALRKYHKILAAPELVSAEEGTGLVHMAPAHGLDDYNIGVRNRLPIFCPVGPDAAYTEEAGEYKGIRVPDAANTQVLKDLKELGMLVHEVEITHSYPHCWRCHSKVIFLATPQWFLNVQKIKKKLLKVNEKIAWHPEEARGWERDLMQSSPDWCISRQRYWATPMPIWKCKKCGAWEVIGSRHELEKRSTNPEYARSLTDMHRPYIDKVLLKCGKCDGEMERVKDVIDVWFDSGMSFRLALSEEQFERLFPVDFIVEYIEQTRAWFQSLLRCGMFAYGKATVRDIAVHGILWGTDGKKMSKSLGNFRPLEDIVKYAGADAFRFWILNHNQIDNRVEKDEDIRDSQKPLLVLYNIAALLNEYSAAIGYSPKGASHLRSKLDAEDTWIASRCTSMLDTVTKSMNSYEPGTAANALNRFIVEDLSRFYLKAAKKRILYGSKGAAERSLDTINYVLFNALIAISPFTPFTAERIYLDRYGYKESIFLEDWPKPRKGAVNAELEKEFEIAIDTITALLNAREKAKARLRWPIAQGTVEVKDSETQLVLEKMSGLIEEYTNVKELKVKRVQGFAREIRPMFGKIGPEFKERAQAVGEALAKADADEIERGIAAYGHYPLHTSQGMANITKEHFTITEKLEAGNAIQFRYGMASVNAEMSRELMEEAMVREFERRVQLSRKEMKLRKTDKILLRYTAGPEMERIVSSNSETIKKDVNAKEIKTGISDEANAKEFDLEDEKLRIEIEKAN